MTARGSAEGEAKVIMIRDTRSIDGLGNTGWKIAGVVIDNDMPSRGMVFRSIKESKSPDALSKNNTNGKHTLRTGIAISSATIS